MASEHGVRSLWIPEYTQLPVLHAAVDYGHLGSTHVCYTTPSTTTTKQDQVRTVSVCLQLFCEFHSIPLATFFSAVDVHCRRGWRTESVEGIYDKVLPLLAELFLDWAFFGAFLVRLLRPHSLPPTTSAATSTARTVYVCPCTSTIPTQR